MEMADPISLDEALRAGDAQTLSIIPWEKENARSIREALSETETKKIRYIGPEGGWETDEVERSEKSRAIPVRLGPTLLRSETAGLVAATLVLAECGVYS